uniref:Uncharacterized protein n=1 Tax=Anguilla anguilla TaxID=7936 RepID=A0A0E9WCW2_ANGAN
MVPHFFFQDYIVNACASFRENRGQYC